MAALEIIALDEATPQLRAPGAGDTYVANRNFAMGASNAFGFSTDLFLRRDAANTLALCDGTAAQAFNVYNTFTDPSNYERGVMRYVSNVLRIGHEWAGTGSGREIIIGPTQSANSNYTITIDPAANGTTGSTQTLRLRVNGIEYFTVNNIGNSCIFGTNNSAGRPTALRSTSAGITIDTGNNGGFFDMGEQTAPATPAANRARIYVEDDGTGKTRACIKFPSGKVVVLATDD